MGHEVAASTHSNTTRSASMTIYTPSPDFIDSMYFKIEKQPIESFKQELLSQSGVMLGELNPMYGMTGDKNPNANGHPQDEAARKLISENNAKHWKDKCGDSHPAYGRKRPDNVERMHLLWEATRGKPSWNKGLTGVKTHTNETKSKMSQAHLGRPKEKVTCPHCGNTGGHGAMVRWHFDNCKKKEI